MDRDADKFILDVAKLIEPHHCDGSFFASFNAGYIRNAIPHIQGAERNNSVCSCAKNVTVAVINQLINGCRSQLGLLHHDLYHVSHDGRSSSRGNRDTPTVRDGVCFSEAVRIGASCIAENLGTTAQGKQCADQNKEAGQRLHLVGGFSFYTRQSILSQVSYTS